MSAISQQAWVNELTPIFLSNPVQYLQISGTPPINLTNNAGILEVNGVPIQTEPVSNWSLYPTLSNQIFLNPSNVIQQIGNDLYFNNEILAVASNISNVADWYLYPALSNVQLNNGVGINFGNPPTVSNLLFSSNGSLWFNGSNLVTNNWSTYPAVSSVNIAGYNISNVQDIYACNIYGREDLSLIANEPLNPVTYADVNLTASGGNRGRINLTANPGLVGVQGEVHIVANGGTSPDPIPAAFGGLIELTANTPIAPVTTLTSAIKLSAAGINSYAGAIPSVGSLAGYNFIYGNAGVNICTGVPSILPNFPGTTYIYGTGGVELESGLAADVQVRASTFGSCNIKPYFSAFIVGTLPDLTITGRTHVLQNDQYVVLNMIRSITMSNGGSINMSNGNISNLCNINGSAYVSGAAWSFYPAGANVNMCNFSISNLTNINGAPYTPTCNWASSPAVGNVDMATFSISNLTNINGSPYVPTSNWASYSASGNVNMATFSISNLTNINGVPYTPTCNWSSFVALSNVDMCNFSLSNISQATFGSTSNVRIQKGANVLASPTPGTETVQILNSLGGTGNLRVEEIAFQNNGGAVNDTVLRQVIDALNPPRMEVLTGVSSNNFVAYLSDVQFRPSNDIYVAPNGDDTNGNGSQNSPFLTIGRAITLRSTLSAGVQVVIHVSAGTYTENLTLSTNTYIIGEAGSSDPATDPTTIVGALTLSATNTGLFNLSVTGNISTTGVGNAIALNNVTVSSSSTFCVSGNATVSMMSCRLSNSAGGCINITSNGIFTIAGSFLTISAAGFNVIQASGNLNITRSRVECTSSATNVSALIRFTTGLALTSNHEITFCKLVYTSTTVDVTGNKCCVQYLVSGTANVQIGQCVFECVGAITGTPNVQCIQNTGSGVGNLVYGNIQAVGNAHHIAPSINKTSMTQVP